MNDLVLSLGSNIEPKEYFLKEAVKKLNSVFVLKKISRLYITEPLVDKKQENFFNICVYYATDIDDPDKILNITKGIESELGRERNKKRPKGHRNIDIDIIFFGEREFKSKELTIPHPDFFKRKFVIVPLIEVLPNDSIYFKKYDMNKFLKKVEAQSVSYGGELLIE